MKEIIQESIMFRSSITKILYADYHFNNLFDEIYFNSKHDFLNDVKYNIEEEK